MSEYISKEDVSRMILNYRADNPKKQTVWAMVISDMLRDLKEIPTAEVQPVKHGRWLNHHAIWINQPKIKGWFIQAKCSECEKWAHVMNPYTKSVGYECCPHCGARMDGDTE